MALNFPDSPTVGQEFTGNGNTWTWDGSTWNINLASSSKADIAGASFTGLVIGKPNTGGALALSNDTGNFSVRNATANDAASISFHRPNIYAVNMGLDTDNAFKIGGWSQGSTPYLQINTSGHVQKPYQPAIWLDGNYSAWANEGARTVKRFNAAETRGGMVWNATTGTVTVPVAGWYQASFSIYMQANTTMRRHIRRNGASRAMLHTYHYNSDNQDTLASSFYCSANDTIDFYLEYTSNIYYGSTHSYASIIYLG